MTYGPETRDAKKAVRERVKTRIGYTKNIYLTKNVGTFLKESGYVVFIY
jgi:hypothetical protein